MQTRLPFTFLHGSLSARALHRLRRLFYGQYEYFLRVGADDQLWLFQLWLLELRLFQLRLFQLWMLELWVLELRLF